MWLAMSKQQQSPACRVQISERLFGDQYLRSYQNTFSHSSAPAGMRANYTAHPTRHHTYTDILAGYLFHQVVNHAASWLNYLLRISQIFRVDRRLVINTSKRAFYFATPAAAIKILKPASIYHQPNGINLTALIFIDPLLVVTKKENIQLLK